MPVPCQDLDFHGHMSWSFFMFDDLWWEVIVRFVDIGGYRFMLNIYYKLMTYLFWSPMKTINFFRCPWLIDIKSGRIISYDFFVLRAMVSKQQIRPSWLVVSQLWAFIDHAIVLSMFMLSFIFVTVCSLFECKRICISCLFCVYICIAIGDPVIKWGGLGSH